MRCIGRCGIGVGSGLSAFVNDHAVYQPEDAATPPVDGIMVEVEAGIEPEIDAAWRTAIAEAERCSFVAGIEIDVLQA